jgi:carbonic anhydrase
MDNKDILKEAAEFLERLPDDGNVVIIGCMDRRLARTFALFGDLQMSIEEKLRQLADLYKPHEDDTYKALRALLEKIDPERIRIFSNAGANVEGLSADLTKEGKEAAIAGIIVACHTKCGGMSVVAGGVVKGISEEDDAAFKHLGGSRYESTFDGVQPSNEQETEKLLVDVRTKIEQLNPEVQTSSAMKFSNDVLALVIDVDDINLKVEGRVHFAVLGDGKKGKWPSYIKDMPMDNTYVIAGSKLSTDIDVDLVRDVIGVKEGNIIDRRVRRVNAT